MKYGTPLTPTTAPTVLCGLCRVVQTPMLGTRRCDSCWELEHRILSAPDLARKVLAKLDAGCARCHGKVSCIVCGTFVFSVDTLPLTPTEG